MTAAVRVADNGDAHFHVRKLIQTWRMTLMLADTRAGLDPNALEGSISACNGG